MKPLSWVKMILPNDKSYITMALSMIEKMSEKIGFNKGDIGKIKIGTEEALVNVIEHAFKPDQEEHFEIICSQIPLGIKIIIKEKGIPFDPEFIPRFNPSKIELDNISLQGLGFFLMKKYMDEIAFTNLGREGKELQLIKYLSSRKLDEYKQEYDNGEDKNKTFIKEQAWISELKKEDAILISKLIYQYYDYYYLSGHLYYPERVIQLQMNKKLYPYVIHDGNGIWGYSALSLARGDHSVGQIDPPVIDKNVHMEDWIPSLLERIFQRANELGLKGVFCRVREIDTELMKVLLHEGGIPVAFQEGFSSIIHKESNETEKLASLMFYFPLETSEKSIYIPEGHKKMIEEIYDQLRIKRDLQVFDQQEIFFEYDLSEFETIIREDFNSATIIINRYGKELFEELDEAVNNLMAKKFDSIYLRLSLNNPLTAYLMPEFEVRRFFFAGILPDTDIGDAIILQSVNSFDVKKKKLKYPDEKITKLCEYVKISMNTDPIQRLIHKGESDSLEFKSTLRWNLRDDKKDSRMEYAVMKTITAFLNSFGGTLLVGVEDDGNILGIEKDGFENHDKFLLHFSNLIKKYVGIEFFEYIRYNIFQRGQKSVFKVDCFKSKKPAFIKSSENEDFFIRSGPSSIKLNLSEAIKYIYSHFSLDNIKEG